MQATSCPSNEELTAFGRGQVSDLQGEQLFEHLRACSDCCAQLETVSEQDDTFIEQIRASNQKSVYDSEPQYQSAIAKAHTAFEETERPSDKSDASLQFPKQIGEYELIRPLGVGGMGRVFLARHNKLDRDVALKLLHSHRLSGSQSRERFENEMRAIGRLCHPNVVAALDARDVDSDVVLITEFIDGYNLEELLRRVGPLPLAEAAEIVRQVAVALQYISQQGFVHRDVKPSNIMLSRHGQVKLLDLGLARLQFSHGNFADVTATGQTMGTADYIAPEQVNDSHSADIRADIYSLGCTLFKLLTGNAPFADDLHTTAFSKMTAHISTPPPLLSSVQPNVPEELNRLVDNMLAKNPASRPQTPQVISETLMPYVTGHNLSTLVYRAENQEPQIRTTTGLLTNCSKPQSSFAQSIPLLAMIAAASLFLGVCFGILIKIKYPDGTQQAFIVPSGSDISQEKVDSSDEAKQPSALVNNADVTRVAKLDKVLQGNWVTIRAWQNGKEMDMKGHLRKYQFTNGAFAIDDHKPDVDKQELVAGVYTLSPRAPIAMDLNYPALHSHKEEGIVRSLDNNRIQLCLGLDGRPFDFDSTDNVFLFELEREKPHE